MVSRVLNDRRITSVVRRVYEDAQRLDWESFSMRDRTAQYARWLADPKVGGVLSNLMSLHHQRLWLKDGLMKEFSRALAGEGPFAGYLREHPRHPAIVVARVLGKDWQPVAGSTAIKPLQCKATNGTRVVRVLWG